MSDVRRVLAVDLGASSGRVIAAQLRDGLASTRPSCRSCDAEATCAAPTARRANFTNEAGVCAAPSAWLWTPDVRGSCSSPVQP